MNPNNFAIVMAGGVGSRFWPWSRAKRPKQFIDVLGTGRTLLQQTFDRINRICPTENILIVTNSQYEQTIAEQLPSLPHDNILCEPQRRNTAPCIAYGAFKILGRNPDANIIVAPSDHIILKEDTFIDVVEQGFNYCSSNSVLLTIGIKPHKPETGYGYIRSDGKIIRSNGAQWQLSSVMEFAEKPDLGTAKKFLSSGDYFWNAGIFIWSVQSILKALESHLPTLYSQFMEYQQDFNSPREQAAIASIFEVCEDISIDYGLMEKASNVGVISTDIGWSDLGSWSALHQMSKLDSNGNSANTPNVLMYDSSDCLVRVGQGKVVAMEGLSGYIVVDDGNALLICRMENEQMVKKMVEDIEKGVGEEFV